MKRETHSAKVFTPCSWYFISVRICSSSRLRRATRVLARATSAFSRSGSYLVLHALEVEFTEKTDANTHLTTLTGCKMECNIQSLGLITSITCSLNHHLDLFGKHSAMLQLSHTQKTHVHSYPPLFIAYWVNLICWYQHFLSTLFVLYNQTPMICISPSLQCVCSKYSPVLPPWYTFIFRMHKQRTIHPCFNCQQVKMTSCTDTGVEVCPSKWECLHKETRHDTKTQAWHKETRHDTKKQGMTQRHRHDTKTQAWHKDTGMTQRNRHDIRHTSIYIFTLSSRNPAMVYYQRKTQFSIQNLCLLQLSRIPLNYPDRFSTQPYFSQVFLRHTCERSLKITGSHSVIKTSHVRKYRNSPQPKHSLVSANSPWRTPSLHLRSRFTLSPSG